MCLEAAKNPCFRGKIASQYTICWLGKVRQIDYLSSTRTTNEKKTSAHLAE
jgi:hypothetical protein